MDIIIALVAFLIAIIVLVTVHEFGHYWVAKRCGVQVLQFAIGFGKTLISWQKNQTIYHLKAIPLGGFVDMLDGNKDNLTANNQAYAFDRQVAYKRFLIVAAGPVFNILFAVLLYTIIALYGITDFKPIIGQIFPNSPMSDTNLEAGDEIIQINQKKTPGIQMTIEAFLSPQKEINITAITPQETIKKTQITLADDWLDQANTPLSERLGFKFYLPYPKAIIGHVIVDESADKAGLLVGDKIIQINKQAIDNWITMTKILTAAPLGAVIDLIIQRGAEKIKIQLTPSVKNKQNFLGIGAKIESDFIKKNQVIIKKDLVESIIYATHKTYDLLALNVVMLQRFLFGFASLKHINGPISIAHYAKQSFELSPQTYLNFIALLSIAIAFFNLLPIPLLDGGHLLFILIESLTKQPLSKKIKEKINYIGLLFIAMLLSIALYNDFLKIYH